MFKISLRKFFSLPLFCVGAAVLFFACGQPGSGGGGPSDPPGPPDPPGPGEPDPPGQVIVPNLPPENPGALDNKVNFPGTFDDSLGTTSYILYNAEHEYQMVMTAIDDPEFTLWALQTKFFFNDELAQSSLVSVNNIHGGTSITFTAADFSDDTRPYLYGQGVVDSYDVWQDPTSVLVSASTLPIDGVVDTQKLTSYALNITQITGNVNHEIIGEGGTPFTRFFTKADFETLKAFFVQ